MLNKELKLNPKIFDKDVEKKSVRKGFGAGLLKAGEADKNVVGLSADLTESVCMGPFKQKFPERFFEIGVAEQNLVTVASGMASADKIPFIGSFAVFSPGRNWEQIRTTVCYNNVPVKVVGSHAGLSASSDGGSHQALEDIALMRVLPRMIVISPCDYNEAVKATIASVKTNTPVYLRLSRNDSPLITTEDTPFDIGKVYEVFRSGPSAEVAIIATGPLLYQALLAGKQLAEEGNKIVLINLSTIKPLDEHTIIKIAHETKAIITVEEHQISGGMGGAVAECLSSHFPVPIEFVGVKDSFGQTGSYDELIKHYGLDEKSIVQAVKRVLMRKKR